MGITAYDETAPYLGYATVVNADGTNKVTVVAAQKVALRLDSILISAATAGARYIRMWVTTPDGDSLIGSINVPLGSGYTGVAAVDFIPTKLPTAIGALILPPGHVLKISCETAVGAGENLIVAAIGGYV